jgi:hypothetical protein
MERGLKQCCVCGRGALWNAQAQDSHEYRAAATACANYFLRAAADVQCSGTRRRFLRVSLPGCRAAAANAAGFPSR